MELDIIEVLDDFKKEITPIRESAIKNIDAFRKKKLLIENELIDLDLSIKKEEYQLKFIIDERIKWCRQNRKSIINLLYPKKNIFYKLDKEYNDATFFKADVVQFYPHLDFAKNNIENQLMVRGNLYDSDMKILYNNENVAIRLLKEPIKTKIKKSIQLKDKITNVYVMLDMNTGYYKIGRSVNPKVREKTLQSEKPTIKMIFNYTATNNDEKELHNMFSDKRIRGEWFDLNANDLITIKKHLSNNLQDLVCN